MRYSNNSTGANESHRGEDDREAAVRHGTEEPPNSVIPNPAEREPERSIRWRVAQPGSAWFRENAPGDIAWLLGQMDYLRAQLGSSPDCPARINDALDYMATDYPGNVAAVRRHLTALTADLDAARKAELALREECLNVAEYLKELGKDPSHSYALRLLERLKNVARIGDT